MSFPTWAELIDSFCSNQKNNPHSEKFASRRYNYSPNSDIKAIRLVFTKNVLANKDNKTLCRNGRFIWCKNLKYEGKNDKNLRQVSFTVDSGTKRFKVAENNILCIPSKTYVNNNTYFRSKFKTFLPFSSVFQYSSAVRMMAKSVGCQKDFIKDVIQKDSPYKPGTLVIPRLGYFYPEIDPDKINKSIFYDKAHPCGIVLGRSLPVDSFAGKEFYRVRFGDTTYERIHPVQMEIINEV